MLTYRSSFLSLLTLMGVVTVPSVAMAGAFVGVGGVPGLLDEVVPPPHVPGKEYSNYQDRQGHPNQTTLDPGQVVDWDGIPQVAGTKDGTDFSDLWTNGPLPNFFEVDALANRQDVWGPVLLFSTGETGLTGQDTLLDDHILYEKKSGPWGIWATPSQIDQVAPDDVDGLEVWAPWNPTVPLEERRNQQVGQGGTEGVPDANRYSLTSANRSGLSAAGDLLGCSIFDSVGTCLVTQVQIATAINNMNYFSFTIAPDEIDLDGLLFYENPVASMSNVEMDYLANIEFSLAPIDGSGGGITLNDPTSDLDGGEIFLWNFNDTAARFLVQGGHVWNTEFSVIGKFGTGSENVDALERVGTPEPSSLLSLLALGCLGVGSAFRHQRRQK